MSTFAEREDAIKAERKNDLQRLINIASKVAKGRLPDDGGTTPDGRYRVRILGGCLWPEDRHPVNRDDVLEVWRDALDACLREEQFDSRNLTECMHVSAQANGAFMAFVEMLNRALEDSHAMGYALAKQKYAATELTP